MKQQDKMFYLLDGMEMSKSKFEWLEQRFANMTEKERLLFTGALELEHPEGVDRAMELTNQLSCFDLYYGAGDDEALGQFILEHLERPSPEAAPFLHAAQVGAAYRERDKGSSVRATICGEPPSRFPGRRSPNSSSPWPGSTLSG